MTLRPLGVAPEKCMIGGRWISPANNESLSLINPSDGSVLCDIAKGSKEDIDQAVFAAESALRGIWGKTTAAERGRILVRLGHLVLEHTDELATLEAQDVGKPYKQARADVLALARYMEFYAGAADKLHGETIPYLDGYTVYTLREPHGVTGHIIPWNYPMQIIGRSVGAALATGNACVLKPAEEACLTALAFAELANKAGLPDGALNVVPGLGSEAGAALTRHKGVHHISFTGSVEVGKLIQRTAADNVVPVTLELGGKSPNIVFEDADFEAAVMGAISGIFAATGQTCIAGSRLLVQRSIHDKFVKRLVEVAGAAKIGDPMSTETHVGPVTTMPQYEKIMDYINIAKSEGAVCVLGGDAYRGAGAKGKQFVQPTIFTGVHNQMRIAQEEVFGPVLSVIPFDTEDEAIAIGNDIVYGLAAGVWTSDIGRALRMSEKLKAGTVWVNTYRAVSFTSPFGGYKRSGEGRESGKESIKEFLQVKSVWIAQQTTAANPFIMR